MKQKKISTVDSVAARQLASSFDPDTIDALLAEAKSSGTPLDGAEGLLTQLTKAVLERALAEEMTEHLENHRRGRRRDYAVGRTGR